MSASWFWNTSSASMPRVPDRFALSLLVVLLMPVGAVAQPSALDTAYAAAESGNWDVSARAWREVLDHSPNLAGAAAFTLRAASADGRIAVRHALLAPPVTRGCRRAEAQLEALWGDPAAGWAALKQLPPGDSTSVAWLEFAEAASASGAPLVARDAYNAVFSAHPSGDVALRAASAALAGGDAAGALAALDQAAALRGASGGTMTSVQLPLRIRALARLGRIGEAEYALQHDGGYLSEDGRAAAMREITWGYVRAGDVARARAAAARFGLADDRDVNGWLALYAGDFKSARRALRPTAGLSGDAVTALALLARTQVDSAPIIGHAFIMLATGDSAAAADLMVQASTTVRDVAPLLLATAARLHAAQHQDIPAIDLWRTVVEQYASAPEAPEADLEWGRALKRHADVNGAIARWEHLILTYPESALVPLARQELGAAKATA
jgi:tetratricopeptide (TPR) repeat protein